MNPQAVVRGVVYIAFVAVLLAAAIVLSERPNEPNAADNSDADLIRCNVLRKEAAHSVACKAVWQARRERFLNAKKAYAQQGLTGTVPAATDPKASPSLGGEQLLAPADRAGPPQ